MKVSMQYSRRPVSKTFRWQIFLSYFIFCQRDFERNCPLYATGSLSRAFSHKCVVIEAGFYSIAIFLTILYCPRKEGGRKWCRTRWQKEVCSVFSSSMSLWRQKRYPYPTKNLKPRGRHSQKSKTKH